MKTVENDVIRSNPETSTTTSTAEPILSNQSLHEPITTYDLKTRKFSTLNSIEDLLPSAKRFASSKSDKIQNSSSAASSSQEKHKPPQNQKEDSRIAKKKQRLSEYFDILQKHYFSSVAYLQGEPRKKALRSFQDDLVKLTSFNRFRDVATIGQVARVDPGNCGDVFRTSNIVSSIEFNKDSELLATAGVTRRIQIFEYNNIMENPNEIHYAVQDIPTTAKLSWVCWNPYIRQHLLSSDYEGFVTLWDVYRGQAISEYEEHENRAWSVDYCPVQPAYFASGSDDGKVKLWSTTQSNSVLTIDNNSANVCSVKFHPTQAEKIAFGSVDLHVHYYDLRNTRQPLQVFKSHSRPVSYVKFMSPTQLISASVDSTVKMWNLSDMSLERTFEGHLNDNNFVGLSVTEDYIACGSEENAVYCYYKAIPRPFTAFPFSLVDPLTGQESRDEDDSRFVSSVCWCPKNPTTLVAANSLGSVKILSLDHTDNSENTEDDENNGEARSTAS